MLDAAKITFFLETTKKKARNLQVISKLSANYYKINYKL